MSDRYLPFSNDDLERDMQDRQNCRVCGRTCSSTVGLCRAPVCASALVEQLEAELELEKAIGNGFSTALFKAEAELAELRGAAQKMADAMGRGEDRELSALGKLETALQGEGNE